VFGGYIGVCFSIRVNFCTLATKQIGFFWGKYCFYSVNLGEKKNWRKNLTTFQNHNFYYEIRHPFLSSGCLRKKKEIKRPMVPSFCGVFVIVLAFVRPIMLVLL